MRDCDMHLLIVVDGDIYCLKEDDLTAQPTKLDIGDIKVKILKCVIVDSDYDNIWLALDENNFLYIISYSIVNDELEEIFKPYHLISNGFQVLDFDIDENRILYIITTDGEIKTYDYEEFDEITDYYAPDSSVFFERFIRVNKHIIVLDKNGNIWGDSKYAEMFDVKIATNELFQITSDINFVNGCYYFSLSLILSSSGEVYFSGENPFVDNDLSHVNLAKFETGFLFKKALYYDWWFMLIDDNNTLFCVHLADKPFRMVELYKNVESLFCDEATLMFTTLDRKLIIMDLSGSIENAIVNSIELNIYGKLPNTLDDLVHHRFHRTKSAMKA